MKNIFLVTVFCSAVFFASAQKAYTPHTEFGIKGGLNISNLHVQNSDNPDTRFSIYLGALAHIHLAKQFALQPELLYSAQGARGTGSGSTYTAALNYINLPVLGQYMFGDGFRVETGPQFGALISAKSKSDGNSLDIKDSYKGFDFAWVFGISYLMPSGFGIDARYNLGISNINDVTTDNNISNRVFAIGVFYQFKD